MNNIAIFILSNVGICFIILLLVKLFYNQKLNKINSDLLISNQKIEELKNTLNSLSIENEQLKIDNKKLTETEKELQMNHSNEILQIHKSYGEKVSELQAEKTQLSTQLQEQEKNFKEQIQLLNNAKEQMKMEFENLAHKILEEKGKAFGEQSKKELDNILNPFREKLESFKKVVEDVYVEEGKERRSLKNEIEKLFEAHKKLTEEADNLVKALKSDAKIQGDWGELNLRRILEFTGLQEGLHYYSQPYFQSEDKESQRPDVVVNLPDNRQIIIDSKVSLTGYERYFHATEETERKEAIKEHLQSIRRHIMELAEKRYENLKGINTLDFVLMFIPIEAAYLVALNNDKELFQTASSRKVLLVCPSTLLITMQLVSSLWRIDNQNKNVLKIAEQGAKLYDKFISFVEDLNEINKHLSKTVDAYENARKKLIDGKGNLVSQAQKLIEMGIKSKNKLPEQLLIESNTASNEDIIEEDNKEFIP